MSNAAARPSSLELARAINSGDADRVSEALDHGASPNGRGLSHMPDFGFFQESPLDRAVSFNDAPLVRLLVERGADVNAVTEDGWSALTNADAADQKDMAELLIELGADPALRTAHGYTPLHRAARRGDRDEQLHAAATQAVDTRNAADETALMLAIRFGREASAAELLRMGADPSAVAGDGERQWSALSEAAHRDTNGDQTTRLVELLLDAGADPNAPGYPPVFSCIGDTDDCVRAMRSLLDAGADPNAVNPTNQDTLVHHALQSGSDDAIELVLSLGLSLESTDRNGRTPLLAVVHQENPDAVRRLVQAGADVTAVDSDGLSAEQLAQDSERTQDLLAALRMS